MLGATVTVSSSRQGTTSYNAFVRYIINQFKTSDEFNTTGLLSKGIRNNSVSLKVKEMLLENAESECIHMVEKLVKFFVDEKVRKRLRTWREEDAPDVTADDFELTKFLAKKRIKDKIMIEIRNWESQDGCLKNALERFQKLFVKKCLILNKEESDIQLILQGDSPDSAFNFEGWLF